MADTSQPKPEAQAMPAQPTARAFRLQPAIDSVAFVFMAVVVGASVIMTILYR